MNKRFTSPMVAILLITLLSACIPNAPSVDDVSAACQQNNVQSGQLVEIGDSEYPCPSSTSTTTPLVNVDNMLIQTLESACKENGDVWQDASNTQWLAQNIVEPASSWKFQNGMWVYTYVPEEIIYSAKASFKTGFQYPGFGTFSVYLFDGTLTTINQSNQSTWLNFTKLELSCQ